MSPTNFSLDQVKKDHPHIIYKKGKDFMWSSVKHTIFYRSLESLDDKCAFLHELGHAILGHTNYESDVDLLKKEVAAWHIAQTQLSSRYRVLISDSYIDNQLDSYRDWLHARSACPNCHQNGMQVNEDRYSCINCSGQWTVNDARRCALRRQLI